VTGPAPAARRPRPRLVPVLPRPAWVVLGGDFVSALGSGLTLPFLFVYAHQVRGLSDGTAGLVIATIALASLAGNPVGGVLADRWTPRRAVMAGLVVAAAGALALAVARSPAALFGAAALAGLGASVIWPAQDALLASLVGPADRSAVFAVRHASLNAGLGAGALGASVVVRVAQPGTFTGVYLADAVSFLAVLPVLAYLGRLAGAAGGGPGGGAAAGTEPAGTEPAEAEPAGAAPRPGFRQVLRDRSFLRVWLLTALIVTISFGQSDASFPGYATRPGGIDPRELGLAFAANTVTVVGAQLFVLRGLAGHRRTTGAALAAVAWAVAWALVIAGGQLGGGALATVTFAAAMVVFAVGESLLSPTLPAIINDLAPPGAAGRYNGLGTLAFTTGFLAGPAGGSAALGAGWGAGLFVVLIAACAVAGAAAIGLGRRLPASANQITPPDEEQAAGPPPVPAPAGDAAPASGR
jgi:MFS family permease